ncbi:unnamed protein product, partial [Hapterophycus canaliculatus]
CCSTGRSSPDALGCGLMPEVVQALLQVQSELPVCTPAIVHVLLHRLAIVRSGKETKQPFFALVSALQAALEACPALPSSALAASVGDCLRRPSPGAAAWSLRATRMFVGGVLSLVSRSPRSLCQAVVSVLVRFVAERECGMNDASLAAVDPAQSKQHDARRRLPCVSCAAAGAASDNAATRRAEEAETPPRCSSQEKRDLVLEGVLRWAVDAHFRRCSRQLQASLNRAVCDGVRQALDAPELSGGHASPACFPPGCRLLLSFVGGLAGDGGAQIASFLRERCGAELQLFLGRVASTPPLGAVRRRCWDATSSASLTAATTTPREVARRRRPALPVLDAYVGHLCLCRHISGPLAGVHLAWLARRALAVLRLSERRSDSGDIAALLTSLSHAIALLLTRPQRGRGGRGGSSSATTVPESSGGLLEILFDSDARPLSGVPRPLAEAALGVLKGSGHLQLTRPEDLLRPPVLQAPINRSGRKEPNIWRLESHSGSPVSREVGSNAAVRTVDSDGASFADGVGFRRASVAFRNSWTLATAGIDTQLPLMVCKRAFDETGDDGGDGASAYSDDTDVDTDAEDATAERVVGNGWGRVPDEVTLRIFSFMTPKRVCRLACVDRAWRKLLMVPRVWRPFFEARWPITLIDVEEDLAGVVDRLVAEGLGSSTDGKSKRKRGRAGVVLWQLPENTSHVQPLRDWMVLYRDRDRAERAARGRRAVKSNFPWLVCPFLGCVCSLKSEFAAKRHLRTHKQRPVKRRVAG